MKSKEDPWGKESLINNQSAHQKVSVCRDSGKRWYKYGSNRKEASDSELKISN